MERREALQKVAWMMGGTLSAPVITGLLQGCQPPAEQAATWIPDVLSEAQGKLVAEVAELIIPTTDTPGAKAANVHGYIDLMLKDCFYEEERTAFLQGLDDLEKKAVDAHGSPFVECDKEAQIALLTEAEQAAQGQEGKPFFRTMKELTLAGYFTSEIGASQALEYVAVPGDYQACIPYQPGQKAWGA